jgi:uncharacterized protein
MKQLLDQFFSSPAYAVVGVSDNREKYGNIVFRYLRDKDFPVYPVNPKLDAVEGDVCYASVSELPDNVKSVVLVVPPQTTERIIQECKAQGITAVWMQPGAESSGAIRQAEVDGITVIHDACVMVLLAGVCDFSALKQWLASLGTSYS